MPSRWVRARFDAVAERKRKSRRRRAVEAAAAIAAGALVGHLCGALPESWGAVCAVLGRVVLALVGGG